MPPTQQTSQHSSATIATGTAVAAGVRDWSPATSRQWVRVRPGMVSGFSLIELTMVVLVVATTAAIVLPQMGTSGDIKAATAARKIIADLVYAQSLSAGGGRPVYVQFAVDHYTLATRQNPGSSLVPLPHPMRDGPYTEQLSDSNANDVQVLSTTFGSGGTIAFDGLGSPREVTEAVGSVTKLALLTTPGIIRIKSGRHIMTISIEPYTGEVSVQ